MMKKMSFNRIGRVVLFLFLALICNSCGYYHMGSMMHPQIQSIAIAEIKNDTREPNLTAAFRNQIAAAFQTDGSLKLKSKKTADCILYCRIKEIQISPVRYETNMDGNDFRPAEFKYTVSAEFTVLIPGRSEPLIKKRSVSASANSQYEADPNTGRLVGMKQAAFELARKIVQYTTEAW